MVVFLEVKELRKLCINHNFDGGHIKNTIMQEFIQVWHVMEEK
jgi:hypothetical protein